MNDLTILLTLKGRKKFTKRWLDWMVEEDCPYKILIADGDADKSFTQGLLKNPNYKNLDIDYIDYPEDINIRTFIRKFSNAISLIKTKYAIYADNDDFIIVNNLKKALIFFESNSEIETLALPHYRFCINNGSTNTDSNLYSDGKDLEFQALRHIENKKIFSDNLLLRLKESIRIFPSDYFVYAIHKTKNFEAFMQETVKYPIDYIFFWERHFTYSVGIVGNISSAEELDPFLVRQEDTSMLASSLIDKERLIKIRFSSAWKRQYPEFVNGLYNVTREYKEMSNGVFKFYFGIYFGINVYLRIIQGLVGQLTRKFKLVYSSLSKFVLWRLGKSRHNLDNKVIDKNINLARLKFFLNKKI